MDGVRRTGGAPTGDELLNEGACAGAFVARQGEGLRDTAEQAGFVVGHDEGGGDVGLVWSLGERYGGGERGFEPGVGALAHADEDGGHDDTGDHQNEEDGLSDAGGQAAEGHGWRLQSLRHWRMPATMALRTAD